MNKSYSRRELLLHSAVLSATALFPSPLSADKKVKLPIPPVLEVGRGKPILLSMTDSGKQFIDSTKKASVWGINGAYLGPTIRCKQGDFVRLSYANKLSQPISMTVPGLQANGDVLGGIGKVLQPNSDWSPILPISQSAATCWYRADTLAKSAYQVYRGLLGMWLIEDDASRSAKLPNQYGINDIPLILQDMSINRNGEQLFNLTSHSFLGNRLLVNGVESPYLRVARGWIRLRILNASVSRTYNLNLDNQQPFLVIAGGLGFIPQPREVTSLHLVPGERVEILVDMNEGKEVTLLTGEKRGMLDQLTSWFASDDELINNQILTLKPEGLLSVFTSTPDIPKGTALDNPITILQERNVNIDVANILINGQRFDPRRIDISAKAGSYERWYLTATSPIGFFIQGAKFVVETFNGQKLPLNEASWRDIVLVSGKMSILVKFEHIATNSYPFTFGCSDLMLADKGCLGMMVVQ